MRVTRRSWCAQAAAAVLIGCGGADGDLKKVRVPKSGVRLNYDLAPGASYDGHLKIGTTRAVEGLAEHLNQNVECDAKLLVVGRDGADGGTVVAARFANMDLDWAVPPEAGLSRDEFSKLAADELRGLELRYRISARGKALARPVPADTLAPALFDVYAVLEAAVVASFVELPARHLQPGDRWTDSGEARKVDATFEGLVAPKDGSGQLARLELSIDSTRLVETDAGARRAQTEGRSRSLFSTTGFFARVDIEARDFDPRFGMAVRQISTAWNRTGEGTGEATSVQQISDPCDPDYVGELPCAE